MKKAPLKRGDYKELLGFFKVQKDHVLESILEIRKIIKIINRNGYNDLSNLICISKTLDTIENQNANIKEVKNAKTRNQWQNHHKTI